MLFGLECRLVWANGGDAALAKSLWTLAFIPNAFRCKFCSLNKNLNDKIWWLEIWVFAVRTEIAYL